jgi:nucleotide-binding universal stress UspA family protein
MASTVSPRVALIIMGPAPTRRIDVDKVLLSTAVVESGAVDLVVMQSHVPGISDYLWGSHGGHLAAHADISVFVVR